MSRRVLKDVAFGLVLQFFILILQFLAALIAVPLGWAPYESAPEDPANAPGWLAAISAMMLIASPGVLLLTGALAQLLRVRTAHDGDDHGRVWLMVVAAVHLLIGVGNGTAAMFLAPGMWVMFAMIWLGPVAVGWWRGGHRLHARMATGLR